MADQVATDVLSCPKCKELLPLRVSASDKNPGRKYYAHLNSSSCRFFTWAEEANRYTKSAITMDPNNKTNKTSSPQVLSISIPRIFCAQAAPTRAYDPHRIHGDFDVKLRTEEEILDAMVAFEVNQSHYIYTGPFAVVTTEERGQSKSDTQS